MRISAILSLYAPYWMIRMYVLCVLFILTKMMSFSPGSAELKRSKEVHQGISGLCTLDRRRDAEDVLMMSDLYGLMSLLAC
jgi:hypothetical protein